MKLRNIFAVVLVIGLIGCSSKPGESELKKSFDDSLAGFKSIGVDLNQYISVEGFKVVDSYEEGNLYVVKAIPKIKITKSIDAAEIDALKEKLGMNASYLLQTINTFEAIEKYSAGELNEQQLRAELNVIPPPKGTLLKGDTFSGLESDYTFRKTENGWAAVE